MSTPTPLPAIRPSRRHFGWLGLGWLVLVLGAVIGGLAWYASTPTFEGIVRARLVETLEQATGGRVELTSFHWRLSHLEFEANNLTIHGLEGPGEVPYAHLDHLLVRAKIISFFQAKVGLNLLQGESPIFHLIIYPDGTTNQPHPKTTSKGGSTVDTLFRPRCRSCRVRSCLLILNQQQIPFDVSANDLEVDLRYQVGRDHYLATVGADDITAHREKRLVVHSRVNLQADLSRTARP